jgi:hypothetical protein
MTELSERLEQLMDIIDPWVDKGHYLMMKTVQYPVHLALNMNEAISNKDPSERALARSNIPIVSLLTVEKDARFISLDSWQSYLAAKRWSVRKFRKHGDKIIDAICETPKFAEMFGRKLSRMKAYSCREKLVESLMKSPDSAHYALIQWELGLVIGNIRDLASACAEQSYAVSLLTQGNYLKRDLIIEQAGDILAPTIKNTESVLYVLARVGANHYHKVKKLIDNPICSLPDSLFGRIEEAYSHMKNSLPDEFNEGKRVREVFITSLDRVFSEGNIEPWIDTILKHYRKDAIGGDTYRGVA